MSGIGEYVHYWQAHYQQSGLARKDGKPPAVSSILNKQKQQFLSQLKRPNNNYIQLQQDLTALLYPNQQTLSGSKQASLDKKLEKLLGEMMLKWSTAWTTKGTAPRSFGGKSTIRLGTIRKMVESINRVINTVHQRYDDVNLAEEKIKELNILIVQVRALESQANKFAGEGAHGNTLISLDNLNHDTYKAVNTALQKISNAEYFKSIGSYLEGSIATLDDRLQGKIEECANGLIKQVITGQNTTSFQESSSISSDFLQTFPLEDGSTFQLSLNGNLDKDNIMKMDVNLIRNNEQYRISAKNYSLQNSNRVHLRSTPKSLLALLQGVASENFINHYLNIISSRKGKGSNISSSLIMEAHQIAKMLLVGEALVGMNQIQGYTDTFVLNNRKAKQIIVKPMKDFFIPFQEALFNITGYDLDLGKNLNHWEGDHKMGVSQEKANLRIAKLLGDLHAAKITVSLNSNLLA